VAKQLHGSRWHLPWRWSSFLATLCYMGTQFSAHICCGQMAGWIKMPLSMEVGRGPGNSVLDGNPAPHSQKGGGALQFSVNVYCGQTAGWITMTLAVEVGLIPGHTVLHGDPAPPPKRGHIPNFRRMSIVAKGLDGSRCHLVQR